MGESKKHVELVQRLVKYVEGLVPDDTEKMIVSDGFDSLLNKSLPPIIGGFRPDLYYEYNDTLVIGEAKTENDYDTEHSINQYVEYLKSCECYPGKSKFILIISWESCSSAKMLLQQISKKNNFTVDFEVIDELTGYNDGKSED